MRVVVFLVLVLVVVYPNVWTLGESLFPDGGFSASAYIRFFSTPSGREALANSVLISFGTVIFSALIGVPLAFAFHRS
jgi:ABC-type spermidine/putrescine transport system permease subunit II